MNERKAAKQRWIARLAQAELAIRAWHEGGRRGPIRISQAVFYTLPVARRTRKGEAAHPSCFIESSRGRSELVPVVFVPPSQK